MNVRAEQVRDPGTFSTIFAVIAEALQHVTQRDRISLQEGASAVILEAHDCAVFPFNRDIADTAGHALARVNSVGIEKADPLQIRAYGWPIVLLQELEAATNGEERDARLSHAPQGRRVACSKVVDHHRLLAVLIPAHEDDVGLIDWQVLAQPNFMNYQTDASPGRSAAKGDDVPTISVKVEEPWIEVRQRDPNFQSALPVRLDIT